MVAKLTCTEHSDWVRKATGAVDVCPELALTETLMPNYQACHRLSNQ